MNEEELKKKIKELEGEYLVFPKGTKELVENRIIHNNINLLKRELEGFQKGKLEQKKEFENLVNKRLPYILCYGLKQYLAEEEINQFKKIFWALLEEKEIKND